MKSFGSPKFKLGKKVPFRQFFRKADMALLNMKLEF